MANQFSPILVNRAWQRSRGMCECERKAHGHIRRCNRMLMKTYQGDSNSAFGWEAYSKSGRYLETVSDIEILCWNPCLLELFSSLESERSR